LRVCAMLQIWYNLTAQAIIICEKKMFGTEGAMTDNAHSMALSLSDFRDRKTQGGQNGKILKLWVNLLNFLSEDRKFE